MMSGENISVTAANIAKMWRNFQTSTTGMCHSWSSDAMRPVTEGRPQIPLSRKTERFRNSPFEPLTRLDSFLKVTAGIVDRNPVGLEKETST